MKIRRTVTRMTALLSTVVLSWGILTVGFADEAAGGPQVGDVAERDYHARRDAEVVDQAATDRAIEAARNSVEPVMIRSSESEDAVYDDLELIIALVADETQPLPADLETVPTTTSSTSSTTTTTSATDQEPAPADESQETSSVSTLDGFVFIDVNGDSLYSGTEVPEGSWTTDRAWAGVEVVALAEDGTQYRTTTDRNGEYSMVVPSGDYQVIVDAETGTYPEAFVPTSADTFDQDVACQTDTCSADPVGLTARFADRSVVIERIQAQRPFIGETELNLLVQYGERDVYRAVFGERPLILEQIEIAATDRLAEWFQQQVTQDELAQVQRESLNDVTSVTIDATPDTAARSVRNSLVAVTIQPNMEVNDAATQQRRDEAAAQVDQVVDSYREGELLVTEGETFTEQSLAAVNETGANVDRTVRQAATGGLLFVLVAVLAFYLAKFRRVYWDRPRMVTLFGMLIVLAAAAVRFTIEFQESSSWYILPAVAFGYLASVLFDNRMGTLMAMAVGVMALVGTGDPSVGVFATLATLAPIGFVSAVSTRRAFRNSVVVSALATAVIAAASSWYFQAEVGQNPIEQIWQDAAWAGGVAIVASLVALAAMPFFEAMFDITTTLRLLELTDRNHEALQMMQTKAFGTFNHSLMVGTLADTAAKAIGANSILARAAAYYHDLGKTENPMFFIENQFGSANPHDDLPPEESARVIRQHVVDGVELARKYNIPSEVSEGIVSHHGDGIMRYFYEKARQENPEVDPDLFRHAGHKPQTREMAILMMSDAVEAACRAVFQDEEPKPESIAKVVNRVIDEKVADGQLSESDLTLHELTTVRRAFIEALTGHYHQRISYPHFPGS